MYLNRIVFGMLALGSVLTSSHVLAEKEGSSLEDLKRVCREYEGNTQINQFSSKFICTEEKTFWVQKGIQKFTLSNESSVSIKALIKDGKVTTDWWQMPGEVKTQEAICPVMEQWKMTAHLALTLNSCAELEKIQTEESFCREQLAPVWNECDAERAASVSKPPFQAPAPSRCEFESLNVVKSCNEVTPVEQKEPVLQTPVDQGPVVQQAPPAEVPGCKLPEGCSPVQQADVVTGPAPTAVEIAETEQVKSAMGLGATLRAVKVSRKWVGVIHTQYQVVMVTDVLPGGLISRLGLRDGDAVAMVGYRRTRDEQGLVRRLLDARKAGKVRLEVRLSNGEYKTYTVNNFR